MSFVASFPARNGAQTIFFKPSIKASPSSGRKGASITIKINITSWPLNMGQWHCYIYNTTCGPCTSMKLSIHGYTSNRCEQFPRCNFRADNETIGQ